MNQSLQRTSTALTLQDQKRRQYADHARAKSTQAVYGRAWERFVAWLETTGEKSVGLHSAELQEPIAPERVADYIIHLSEEGLAASTLDGSIAAIRERHLRCGLPTPTAHPFVREILTGARKMAVRDGRGRGQAAPILPSLLEVMLRELPESLRGDRDRALLTLGLAGGFRREELARLCVEHLIWEGEAVLVRLPWSKGHDEESLRRIVRGASETLCPVRNLQIWLERSDLKSGPIFRAISAHDQISQRGFDPRRVDQIVREVLGRARRHYPDEVPVGRYSAHSLRSGLITAALMAGKDVRDVQQHVDHRSVAMTLRYARNAATRTSTVTEGIGL